MRIPYLSSLCFMGRHARSSDCQIWLTRFNCIVGGYGVELTTATFFSEVCIISKNVCAVRYIIVSEISMISCLLFLPYYTSIVLCIYIPPFFSSAYCIKSLCWESNLHEAPRGFRFIGDKETHIRTTSQEFDSSDFIGYLKGRSEMTS